MSANIEQVVARLESVVARLEKVEAQIGKGGSGSGSASSSSASESTGEVAPFVQEYQDLINAHIPAYVAATAKIGDAPLKEQAALVEKALAAQVAFLNVVAQSKKPADADFVKLIQPTSAVMVEIGAIKDKSRQSKLANHLAAVSEGIGALGWVTVTPAPVPYANEMRGQSEFWSNRVLKEFKGVQQDHVDWVAAFNGFLKELPAYIKKHHTTGVAWNPRGGDASQAKAAAGAAPAAAAASSASSAPAPPPPPPADYYKDTSSSASAAAAPAKKAPGADLFAELSKGTAVTSGLRKVTDDMKTKNRPESERSSVVPVVEPKKTTSAAAAPAAKKVMPPKCVLDGTRWLVEHQIGNKSITVEATESKQTVYVYRCKDSVVRIKGKVNAINMDECVKTALVFDDAIASFEAVNCKSIEVQVLGRVPTFGIDKTDGFQLHLSKGSLDSEIVSSKCSEMNVSFPVDGKEDPAEVAVPEQFKTVVKNGTLHTTIVEHSG